MEIASYTTPTKLVQTEFRTGENPNNDDITELCLEASRDFEALCGGKIFYPRLKTMLFDHPDQFGNVHHELPLKEDLLQVTALTTNNGQTTIAAGDYFLRTGKHGKYGQTPYDRIQLEYGSTGYASGFQWDTTPQQANSVTGFWGFVEDWEESEDASCWVDSNATISSVTASTLVLDSLAGSNSIGLHPRVDKFDLVMWHLGTYASMEMGFVTDVDLSTNTLTVNRGVNGTTALVHAGTPNLYVFKPSRVVVRAVRRLAAYYYRMRQTARADIDRPILTANGTMIIPSSYPKDVIETASRFNMILE